MRQPRTRGELTGVTENELIRLVYPYDRIQSRTPYEGNGLCCYIDDVHLLSAAAGEKTFHLIHASSLKIAAEFAIGAADTLFIDSIERAGDCMIFTFSDQAETDNSDELAQIAEFRVPIAEFLRHANVT